MVLDDEGEESGESAVKVAWLVPTLIACYLIAYVLQVRHLPLASTAYPYLLIGLIGIGVAWVGVGALRATRRASNGAVRPRRTTVGGRPRVRYGRAVALVVMASVYPAALPQLGFTFATFLLLVGLLRAFGERRLWRTVAVAAVVSMIFFAGIDLLLGIPLPTFPFAELPLGL